MARGGGPQAVPRGSGCPPRAALCFPSPAFEPSTRSLGFGLGRCYRTPGSSARLLRRWGRTLRGPSPRSDLGAHRAPVRPLCGRRAPAPRPGPEPGEHRADGHVPEPAAPPHRAHPEGEVVAPQAGAARAVRVRSCLPLHQPSLLLRPCGDVQRHPPAPPSPLAALNQQESAPAPLLPLPSPCAAATRDGVVQDEGNGPPDEHLGGQQHRQDLVQLGDTCDSVGRSRGCCEEPDFPATPPGWASAERSALLCPQTPKIAAFRGGRYLC